MPLIFHRYGCADKAAERYTASDYSDDTAVLSYRVIIIGAILIVLVTIVACVLLGQWMQRLIDPSVWRFWSLPPQALPRFPLYNAAIRGYTLRCVALSVVRCTCLQKKRKKWNLGAGTTRS